MKTTLPEHSLLQNVAHDYCDSYAAALDAHHVTIEQVGRAFFTASPAWVDRLLRLRNRLVTSVGLKVPGAGTKEEVLRHFQCQVGESVGLFNILAKTDNEIIIGEDDKHLDFRVSLFLDRPQNRLTVSTLVKRHNTLGWLYFFFVKPFHKIIVPTITKGMSHEINQARFS